MHTLISTFVRHAGCFILCLALPVMLAACRERVEVSAAGSYEAGARVTVSGQPAADTVRVTLLEYSIEMPATLSPGRTVLVVLNSGTMAHNFRITGQGIEQVFPASLLPGQSRMMTVDLRPGSYDVYCPADNHRQIGMFVSLKVPGNPAPADTTATTDTTGFSGP